MSLWQRSGVEFPRRPPDAAPIFTPPVTHPISRHPQPGYGMPSSSSTRLDEAMAAEDNLRFGLDLSDYQTMSVLFFVFGWLMCLKCDVWSFDLSTGFN